MAMNGNEGGSAYPPNPDVKSGSCLIAGFHALTDIRPSYWNAYKAESGATFSIDMVRLKLSFINGKGEWLSTHAQTFDCDSMSAWTSKIRPGAADVRGWEAAGKAERGAILDRICAKCDGLASRIRADVAGIWLKVEELRSRISRPLEYLMPKPKTEQRGLDEMARDATRAAEAWNRNHAAPARSRGQTR